MVLVLPEVVLSWLLARVDQRVLNELHDPVDMFKRECLGVECLMVMRAQGDAIVRAGFAIL